ncbi:MAG TPA: TAXI family TRAP transporter solute-binding subunit [bacterium]|nr:TAXI family TRAP transporter solute-binding subunit [bacterium]
MKPRLNLKLMGDWGNANFHIIVGWIAANLRWRSAPGSEFLIYTGTGYRDNIDAVAKGLVDLAVTTPADVCLEWARAGKYFFEGTPYPHLRALGYIPQDDRLVFAVRADTGITSFADLKSRRYPLRIATTCRDPLNLMSYAVEQVFRAHGIGPKDIESWGGKWLEHDHPRKCLTWVTRGEADAAFNEGIMVPQWYELVKTVPMRFVPMESEALRELESMGLRPAVHKKERFNSEQDVACLDWSHWAIVVREDMSEDIAHLLTAVMVEERSELESRYRHLPPERSPMTYPIDPYTMWKGLGAPLHSGAERYYRENGYMS